jgi:ferrous iron transport protein B
MNSPKWTVGAISYMCALAYAVCLIIYQFGLWFTNMGGNIIGTAVAAVVLGFILYMLLRKNKYRENIK